MVVGARQPRCCRYGLESHVPASPLAHGRHRRRTPRQQHLAARLRDRAEARPTGGTNESSRADDSDRHAGPTEHEQAVNPITRRRKTAVWLLIVVSTVVLLIGAVTIWVKR